MADIIASDIITKCWSSTSNINKKLGMPLVDVISHINNFSQKLSSYVNRQSSLSLTDSQHFLKMAKDVVYHKNTILALIKHNCYKQRNRSSIGT